MTLKMLAVLALLGSLTKTQMYREILDGWKNTVCSTT